MLITRLVLSAVLGTIPLDGELPESDEDYAIVELEVPEGVVEIEIAHASLSSQNTLDWGLWGPSGFRGWGGGSEENAIIGEHAASHGYLPGPITPGTWLVVIGKAWIRENPAPYALEVTFRDEETLTPRERASFEPVVIEQGPRWYRGDLHVHSFESTDATATFDEIAAIMRERSLDFVAVTDHNTTSQHALLAAYQQDVSDFLFIRGMEITTYQGHANAWGISEYVDHRAGLNGRSSAEMVADVLAQGGLFSVNHPTMDLGALCIGCAWDHEDTPWQDVAAIEIQSASYDATVGLFTPRAIELWDSQLDQGHHITAVGGSDDHRAGIDLPSTGAPIGSPTTLVWADELSEAAILEGVAAGRVIVQLRGPDDPMVELALRTEDQTVTALGETVVADEVELEVAVEGGEGLEALVVRNGLPDLIEPIDAASWSHTFEMNIEQEQERVRVQIVDGSLPIVVTNHFYIQRAGDSSGGGCAIGAPGAGQPLVLILLLAALWLGSRYPRSAFTSMISVWGSER